jgi:hypothetical protein
MTILEFRANEALVAAFAELIKANEFRLAIEIVKNAYLPISSEPPVGVSFETWNSHQNTRREGFYEAIRLIELMAKPVSKRKETSTRSLMPSLVNEDTYEPAN